MAEIPYLVKDLALILMVAGIVTLIFKRLKQPLVLGYIVAAPPSPMARQKKIMKSFGISNKCITFAA